MGAILWISFLSGMSTPVGGWIVLLFRKLSQSLLAIVLGITTGIMVTVVLTELMPASIRSGSHAVFIGGFVGGWGFLFVLRKILSGLLQTGKLGGNQAKFLQMGWFIALAIALHDLPEGIAIGAGGAIHKSMGFIIAFAIALHNIPEGMSIALPLYLARVSKLKIMVITVLTGLVTPMGTALSLWLFQISPSFISISLAFASGAMLYVVARDILPEAIDASLVYAGVGTVFGSGVMVLASVIIH
jgi:zinc transporter, ZIP family